MSEQGLSPRVRGNLPRSIPACAGEPIGHGRLIAYRVYPRVCGGTDSLANGICWSIPACAGEPCSVLMAKCNRRSIPACAGEPC